MGIGPLHTAVETPTYLAALKKAKLSEADRDAVLDEVMSNPQAGDVIVGGGGVRKVRVGKEDSGKSGGYRALTYFMDENDPVHLLFILNKNAADNLSAVQTKALRILAKAIKNERNKAG